MTGYIHAPGGHRQGQFWIRKGCRLSANSSMNSSVTIEGCCVMGLTSEMRCGNGWREWPEIKSLIGVFNGIQFGYDGDTRALADKLAGCRELPDFQQAN